MRCPQRMRETLSVGTFLVALCPLLARFWLHPADGSRQLTLYELVNSVAQNKGHAANADDAAGKYAGDRATEDHHHTTPSALIAHDTAFLLGYDREVFLPAAKVAALIVAQLLPLALAACGRQ